MGLLTSLIAQTQRLLPPAVAEARDQQCSWAQIGDLLGVTRASAQQRYSPQKAVNAAKLRDPQHRRPTPPTAGKPLATHDSFRE